MASQEPKVYRLQINDLKTLSLKMEDEPTDYQVGNIFSFTINVEHLVDAEHEAIHVVINVFVYEPERPNTILSSIQVIAIYTLPDFKDIITKESEDIPEDLRMLVHGITISTTRGILYSSLRGTYLQKAILPIVNPQTLVVADQPQP